MLIHLRLAQSQTPRTVTRQPSRACRPPARYPLSLCICLPVCALPLACAARFMSSILVHSCSIRGVHSQFHFFSRHHVSARATAAAACSAWHLDAFLQISRRGPCSTVLCSLA